jgi:hypothetical protein
MEGKNKIFFRKKKKRILPYLSIGFNQDYKKKEGWTLALTMTRTCLFTWIDVF